MSQQKLYLITFTLLKGLKLRKNIDVYLPVLSTDHLSKECIHVFLYILYTYCHMESLISIGQD